MDTLPVVLSAPCERVDSVTVDGIQDASVRRIPFQQKIGAGLEPDDFRQKADRLEIRHVGLTESVAMIGAAFGWKLDRITDVIEPKIAAEPVASNYISVAKGQVAGLIQDGIGYQNGEPNIQLHMEAYLGSSRDLRRGAHRGFAVDVLEDRWRHSRGHRHGLGGREHDSSCFGGPHQACAPCGICRSPPGGREQAPRPPGLGAMGLRRLSLAPADL